MALWIFWPYMSFWEIGVRPAFHMGPLKATEWLEVRVRPHTIGVWRDSDCVQGLRGLRVRQGTVCITICPHFLWVP